MTKPIPSGSPVAGLGRGRDRCADPAGITGGPPAIGTHLGQHCVDVPDKVGVPLGDGHAGHAAPGCGRVSLRGTNGPGWQP